MKKVYEKPAIMFEDFTMSTSIAAGCEAVINTPSGSSCGYQPEGYNYTIFLTGMNGCDRKYEDGTGYNGLCYHVPSSEYNLFNS